ncbi:MAG: omptin family outer membrane protease [Spirochaetota bacterium]
MDSNHRNFGGLKAWFPVLALSLAIAAPSAYAEDPAKPDFEATSGLGLRYGGASAFVYDRGRKLSELDWDIKPLVSIDSSARLSIGHFVSDFAVSMGLPLSSGLITDSDWQNAPLGDTTTKTNYSVSAAAIGHYFDVGLLFGYDFPIGGKLSLAPEIGFRYCDIAWSAEGGWLQYADNGSNASPPYNSWTTGAKSPIYGLVSTYGQVYAGFLLGLRAHWAPSTVFSLEGQVDAAPILVAIAVDNHVFRNVTFSDIFLGGYLVEPLVTATYSPHPDWALKARLGWTLIGGLVGDDIMTGSSGVDPALEGLNPGQSQTFVNAAGAALSALRLGFSASFQP